ncbi:mitotic checkpoint protein-domain-containing protein [Kalaharituber pfeilii]|nr:mitotic checkpoint protein-domain-containing protein [Kalaharituber pfeilii]
MEVLEEQKTSLEGKVRMMEDLRNEISLSGYDSPQAIARALMEEKVERRAEKERDELKMEMDKVVESYKKLHISRARIERNRQLALKEVGMLREQLKSFSTEETNLMDGNHDAITSSAAAEEASERLGQLTRRARHYQEEVNRLKKSEAVLKKELKAMQARIEQLEKSTAQRTRILELRDNPTANSEKVKMEQLRTLRAENAALMAQLRGCMHEVGKVVPVSSLDALQQTLDELKQQVAEKEKRMARLKQIWTQKSVEWRQAVHSIVGILFDFMPNGRVRVSSREWYDDGAGGEGTEEPGITFDGEQGTMKISPEGFSQRISPLVKEWVEVRGDIPGLIAALRLRSYENGPERMEE